MRKGSCQGTKRINYIEHSTSSRQTNNDLPGEPEYSVNGGTTVSGGRTVLSAMAQQSFSTLRRPFKNYNVAIHLVP